MQTSLIPLSSLPQKVTAEIVGVAPMPAAAARNRLSDLGFVPGSRVSIDLCSPLGNPTAYLICGSVIALRKDQAKYIMVRPLNADDL